MGLPTVEDNLKKYIASSVLGHVKKLANKKYMLVHGTGDDNVHYQQSMALAKVLSEADILYDQVSYPDETHSLFHVTKHLYHTMDKFWSECFNY
jgi:dipeptidyl-peptidase-4